MGKRTDIKSILIIGAGPIIIGQACEFDYSGTQAALVLRKEGYRTILLNSNPATIMTDPALADKTYIEPITAEIVEKILQKESPDALLPTMGGQTALNVSMQLYNEGILKKYNVELIGAQAEAIEKAENREAFKIAMQEIGLETPRAYVVKGDKDIEKALQVSGLPAIIRPSYTLGGLGGGIAYTQEAYHIKIREALDASPVNEVLVEESVLGWKEYEMEVVRDKNDNAIIICSIENIDPMGVHTGDSITVCPAMTLTDKEYQIMRDASIAVLRKIGVETGGSNVQFAVNPADGRMVVIEMNPRVSRSSALASKATGFPIAKVAARLAVGYTLDELSNEITGGLTPCAFEPTIDYIVTKIPRFTFEKFVDTDSLLSTTMKSVGEAMAIGRSFHESIQKALRSIETGLTGFEEKDIEFSLQNLEKCKNELKKPRPDRLLLVAQALRFGVSVDEIYSLTKIDTWFIERIADIIAVEKTLLERGLPHTADGLRYIKMMGFSNARLAKLVNKSQEEIEKICLEFNVIPFYRRIDTCAAEFPTSTAYMYGSYESPVEHVDPLVPISQCESQPSQKQKIIILGGGPNRIGQGIEFDYCCVRAAMAFRKNGYETIMINCNPETVSTDYDASDRLYFEPLTAEDVLHIIRNEKREGNLLGVVTQFGGQTPLQLSEYIEAAGIPILGTSFKSIQLAEDREHFKLLLERNNLKQPRNGIATNTQQAKEISQEIGYPIVIRPSFVLGGRAMEIVYSEEQLMQYITQAVEVSGKTPVLIDKYLDKALELDVDAIYDGDTVYVCGIMEHIEEAGIHSGDSACCLPTVSLSTEITDQIKQYTKKLAEILNVKGFMNVQYAIKDGDIYILEVNPRASRTIPFVAKATGVHLVDYASFVMTGGKLSQCKLPSKMVQHICVKESVFPFSKFPGVDTVLGPEMRSTGEVMGIDDNFGLAFAKSQMAAGITLPKKGNVFLSVSNESKPDILEAMKLLDKLGFTFTSTQGTANWLEQNNIACERTRKVYQGNPNCVDMIYDQTFCLVLNTPGNPEQRKQSQSIRRAALVTNTPYYTTANGINSVVKSIDALRYKDLQVVSLQERIY